MKNYPDDETMEDDDSNDAPLNCECGTLLKDDDEKISSRTGERICTGCYVDEMIEQNKYII